jgi:hypothetical protein
MVTGAEIGLGFRALKTAFDIAKEAKELTDTTAIRSKIIEMQSLIMEAQTGAIEAREVHAAQVSQIRELEAEVARLKAWDAEKQDYELRPVTAGSFAYVPKVEVQAGEEVHRYCASCFDGGKKSILQAVTRQPGRAEVHVCHQCGSEVYQYGSWHPEHGGTKSASRRNPR